MCVCAEGVAVSLSVFQAAGACRFGERIVPARFETGASLTCASPLGAPVGQVYISSSDDGGASWSPSSARFVFYDLSRPLTLTSVTPASAAVAAAAADVRRRRRRKPAAAAANR